MCVLFTPRQKLAKAGQARTLTPHVLFRLRGSVRGAVGCLLYFRSFIEAANSGGSCVIPTESLSERGGRLSVRLS